MLFKVRILLFLLVFSAGHSARTFADPIDSFTPDDKLLLSSLGVSLQSARLSNDWKRIAAAYFDISSFYEDRNYLNEALVNCRRAGCIVLKHKDFDAFAEFLYRSAAIRKKQHLYDFAFRYCSEALIYFQLHKGDLAKIDYGLHELAELYALMGDYRSAASLIKDVIRLRTDYRRPNDAAWANYEMANIYAKGRICGADDYVAKAAKILDDHSIPDVAGIYHQAVGSTRKFERMSAERYKIEKLKSTLREYQQLHHIRAKIILISVILLIIFTGFLLFGRREIRQFYKPAADDYERLGEGIISFRDICSDLSQIKATAKAVPGRFKALVTKYRVAG